MPGHGPDDVPRSPSGRTPEWVVREARGERVDPTPFRAAPTGGRRRRRGGQGRSTAEWYRGAAVVLAVVGALTAVLWYEGFAVPSASRPSNGPTPGYEEGPRPAGLAGPAAAPVSTSFEFLHRQVDGVTPVGWDPCRPIHWVVRPDNQPVGGQKLLTDAFATVSELSGLQFVYDGETAETPDENRPGYLPDLYGDRWAPVVVAWAPSSEVPVFGTDVIGEATPYSVQTPSGDWATVSGSVWLDSDDVNDLIAARHADVVHSVVLHELGHLVGLAHVNDTKQLMYPQAQLQLTEVGPGDVRGFAFAGQGACQPDV